MYVLWTIIKIVMIISLVLCRKSLDKLW